MQQIHHIGIDAEQYVAEAFQRRITAPAVCPHCERTGAVWALGYYVRNLTRLGGGVLRIVIRRFRCTVCRKTISILPSFAQPYRFVQNGTIETFVSGDLDDRDVLRWIALLRSYWRRFVSWVPKMKQLMTFASSRSPPDDPRQWWDSLIADYGDFASATRASVSLFQITFFGRYWCHRPNPRVRDR